MGEHEWLTSADPEAMLAWLGGRCEDRKLRLFAVACCRQVWHFFTDPYARQAVEAAEYYADGRATWDQLRTARDLLRRRCAAATGDSAAVSRAALHAAETDSPPWRSSVEVIRAVSELYDYGTWLHQRAEQAELLRDLIGNPFRPVAFDAAEVSPSIQAFARAVYRLRRFDQLPRLADALERSVPAPPDVLSHCQGKGPHARGCWALDLVLGKG
ncbi:MAG TPA: hypothetical protein VIL46_12500 [Gemmataceae bacterium]